MTNNNSLCVITPILPHKIGNVKDLIDDMCEKRRGDMEKHMREVGVKKVLAFIQAMQVGDFFVEYLEMADSHRKDDGKSSQHAIRRFREYARSV